MERLFGNTWFRDEVAYKRTYTEWDIFKVLVAQSIHGMTVNERLFSLGLFEEFNEAVARQDESRLRGVLLKCFVNEYDVEIIVRQKIKKG
jgi:hypothetical protein